MNVLLVGSGGREHALAWKLAQSPKLTKLFAAPGNPGIAQHAELVDLDPADHRAVVDFCRANHIGLVVIGPEAPLVDGLGDALRTMAIAVFGPNRIPAQVEGSKLFTKELCEEHDIPTARYQRVTNIQDAVLGILRFDPPWVVKADGLAAGKGVVIAASNDEAGEAIRSMLEGSLGEAGREVIVEDFLEGEEVSFFALTDGETVLPFGSAQDHKRVGDGDTGPNTGGMGAYSPASILTPQLEERVMAEIVRPTVRALAERGTPYSGILYAGLMLTADGPKLIEYNARFGDPECQVLMMRLDGDLLELMLATAEGRLAEAQPPRFAPDVALTVILAAQGYPGTPAKGGKIAGLDAAESKGARVFHAGTSASDDGLVASGGRVLAVTARGADIGAAREAAYAAVEAIDFPSGFYRRDIGWRELERQASAR